MAWGRHPSLSLTNCMIDIPVFSVLVITVDAIPSHMINAITSVDVIRGGYITSCIFIDVSWLLWCRICVRYTCTCTPLWSSGNLLSVVCCRLMARVSMDRCISILPDVPLPHMYLDCMYVQVDLRVHVHLFQRERKELWTCIHTKVFIQRVIHAGMYPLQLKWVTSNG